VPGAGPYTGRPVLCTGDLLSLPLPKNLNMSPL